MRLKASSSPTRLTTFLLLLAIAVGSATAETNFCSSLRLPSALCSALSPRPSSPRMKAVVVGGTGAVGREIVLQLLSSDKWTSVTTVGRRPLDAPSAAAESTAANARALFSEPGRAALAGKKLRHVDAPDVTDLPAEAFAGADAVFCALGTTRGDAGSAEAFLRVDLGGVRAAVAASKQASGGKKPARFFGLVSASGANSALPAPHFVGLHPLLYSQTKGAAEDAVREAGFESASAYRPGLLSRGAKARAIEKVLRLIPVVPRIAVANVARVAVADAERALAPGGGGPPRGWRVYDMVSLLVASGREPPAPN
jgi:oxidoreductase